jgi:phage-related protein|tara:strand:- start:3031 stop:3369 length:339 start_codon:yes stop_codon:yes gene_type:complete
MANTFSFSPSYSVEISQQPNVTTVELGDNYQARFAKGLNNNLKKWQLTFKNRTDTERTNILNFLDGEGGRTAFNFTDPFGQTAKYIARSWNASQTASGLTTIKTTFEQVAEP